MQQFSQRLSTQFFVTPIRGILASFGGSHTLLALLLQSAL
jgi:hypothetical protein